MTPEGNRNFVQMFSRFACGNSCRYAIDNRRFGCPGLRKTPCIKNSVTHKIGNRSVIFLATRLGGKTQRTGTLVLCRCTAGLNLHLVDCFNRNRVGNRTVIALHIGCCRRNAVQVDLGKIAACSGKIRSTCCRLCTCS